MVKIFPMEFWKFLSDYQGKLMEFPFHKVLGTLDGGVWAICYWPASPYSQPSKMILFYICLKIYEGMLTYWNCMGDLCRGTPTFMCV